MDKRHSTQHDRLLVYGLYSNYIQAIKHFDSLQASYRVMASRLLLATFAAVGFVLSLEVKTLPFDRLIAVMLVCLISCGAITTLWHLDLGFIERLSLSIFAECLKLEKKHRWLTRAHHNMLENGNHAACPSRKVVFYLGSLLTILLTMGIAATIYAETLNSWIWIPVLIGFALLIWLFLWKIKKSTKSFSELMSELEKIDGR